MAQVSDVDCWDLYAPDCYWQPMPPMSLAEANFGEPQSLFVKGDCSGDVTSWYVTRGDGDRPAGPFRELAEAKRAGDAILADAYANSARMVAVDAGLDPDAWSLSPDVPPAAFTSSDLQHVVAYDGPADAWNLTSGDDHVGSFKTPALAAASVPAPGHAP